MMWSAEPTTPPPGHEDTPTLRHRHRPHHTTLPPPYIGHVHFILIVPFHVDTDSSHFLHSLPAPRDHGTFVHCVMFPVNAHCVCHNFVSLARCMCHCFVLLCIMKLCMQVLVALLLLCLYKMNYRFN